MKNPFLISLAFISFFACSQNEVYPPMERFNNGVLEVDITENLSQDSLENLKTRLLANHNVVLDWEELVYNQKNKIEQIRIKVASPKGESGTASSTRVLGQPPHVWFRMDFNEGAAVTFRVGSGKH